MAGDVFAKFVTNEKNILGVVRKSYRVPAFFFRNSYFLSFGWYSLVKYIKLSAQFLPFSSVITRGSHRDVVYLGWPMAPSYVSPNVGRRGWVAGSRLMSTAVHMEPK
jgi:hypothetical protein